MVSTLSSIVDMNAKGVALSQQNNLDEATNSFRRALACLFELVETKEDSNAHHHRTTTGTAKKICSGTKLTDTSESMQTKIVESISIDHPQSATKTNYLSTSPDNSFDFYNRAFVLNSSSANGEEVHECVMTVMTAIMLYNKALTYHTNAVRSGATKKLHRALKLYRMSFRVLQENPDISCDMVDLLLLALVNNMGFIYSHFYDWAEMKKSHEILHSLFMSTCDISNSLEAEEYTFFSYVISPHYQTSSVSAPAA
jgi:hypothetical protein